ncbi:MAG: response regulator [Bacteroidales bacterium]
MVNNTPDKSHKNNTHSNHKILVVEDDFISFYLIKEILVSYAPFLIHKTDGQEAINYLEKEHSNVSLIILDIILPVMDGINTIKIIRKKNWNIPVIAISAAVNKGNEEKCYEAGCNAFLTKPLDFDKFKVAVYSKLSVSSH